VDVPVVERAGERLGVIDTEDRRRDDECGTGEFERLADPRAVLALSEGTVGELAVGALVEQDLGPGRIEAVVDPGRFVEV
jgi:hypothetical protein